MPGISPEHSQRGANLRMPICAKARASRQQVSQRLPHPVAAPLPKPLGRADCYAHGPYVRHQHMAGLKNSLDFSVTLRCPLFSTILSNTLSEFEGTSYHAVTSEQSSELLELLFTDGDRAQPGGLLLAYAVRVESVFSELWP